MSFDNVAIRVTNLSKCYQVYRVPNDRLRQFIWPRLQRFVGETPQQYFKEFWALKDVSFEIKKGETVGIIGRNGSGKSTLLQLICGTLTPSNGAVEFNGRVAALLELGSGFNSEFTGRENIYMYASVLGLSTGEIDARYDEIIAFADIGDFIEQPVKTYSSGMTVRLAFAVIAHVDADILVIDEALSVGDAFFVQKCMRFLRSFMTKGTVLFVSHDTGAVLNLCQKTIWLHDGVIKAQGKPKEITESYLEMPYKTHQDEGVVSKKQIVVQSDGKEKLLRDMRLDFINQTVLRNDIELFQFSSSAASFGKGGAIIKNAHLLGIDGKELAWVIGGERVIFAIYCKAKELLRRPIIGFQVKDHLGQVVFGDNTYLSYVQNPVIINPGECFSANFEFIMPVLPMGDYTISPAVADGTQENHVQHHWVHDAIAFKSHSTSVSTGLVGVPMANILLSKL